MINPTAEIVDYTSNFPPFPIYEKFLTNNEIINVPPTIK